MKSNIHKQPILYILILALLIRLLYLFQYQLLPDYDILTVDNLYHFNWANAIASGNWLGDTTYFRAPFYIYCLALLFSLFGSYVLTARIFGLFIGLCSILVTYLLGKNVFEKKVGLTAALIQSLTPILIYFEFELLLDPLFMLLLQLALLALVKSYDTNSKKLLILSGIIFGLAAITRPTILPFIPFVILILFYKKEKLSLLVKRTALLTLCSLLIIMPVFLRNIVIAEDPVLISSQGGINFYLGNRQGADGVSASMPDPLGSNWQLPDIIYEAEKDNNKKLKPGEISSYWISRTTSEISSDPINFLKLFAKKVYYFISDQEFSNNRSFSSLLFSKTVLNYLPISNGILFPFLLLSFFYGYLKYPKARLIIIIILGYIVLTSLFFVSSRFRIPIYPIMIILLSSTIFVTVDYLKKNTKRGMLYLSILIVSGIFTMFPFFAPQAKVVAQSDISKAKYYYDTGDYQKAKQHYKKAWALNPELPESNLNLGAVFLRTGELDSAQYYLEQEYELFPFRNKATINLSSLAYLNQNYANAFNYANIALDYKPYDPLAIRMFIRSLIRLYENRDVTNNIVSKCVYLAEVSNYNLSSLKEIAAFLYTMNKKDELKQILLKAIDKGIPPIEMDGAAFHRNYEEVYLQREKDKATLLLILGRIFAEQGKFIEAASYYKLSIGIDSLNPISYQELYQALNNSNQVQQADSIYNIIRQNFPTEANP